MRQGWADTPSFEISLANSAAILRYPQTAYDWVRPGIMLYGGCPFAESDAASFNLKPVMTLHSRILAVQEIKPGERVGYGVFEATRPTWWASSPVAMRTATRAMHRVARPFWLPVSAPKPLGVYRWTCWPAI